MVQEYSNLTPQSFIPAPLTWTEYWSIRKAFICMTLIYMAETALLEITYNVDGSL